MMVWCGTSYYLLQLVNGAAAAIQRTTIGQSWCAKALQGPIIHVKAEAVNMTCLNAMLCVRSIRGCVEYTL